MPFPEPQIAQLATLLPTDPMPSPGFIPPESEIPNIPTADDPPEGGDVAADDTSKRDTIMDPPPRYQTVYAPDLDEQSLIGTEPDSAITEGPKNAVIQRAETLRKEAQEKEKERDQLRQRMRDAEREGLYFEALKYQVDLEEAHETAQKLHNKASRRFYHGSSSSCLSMSFSLILRFHSTQPEQRTAGN